MARKFTVSARITAEDRASGTIGKVESRFSKLGTSIKANALKITASLAAITVAFRTIRKSADELGQRDALTNTLARQGKSIDTFIGKLKELSDNQISNANLVLASNRALALGIAADDLPGLLTTAAQAAVDLGISTTQAFNDITTGVGRASPLILDNLGIVIDATKTYAAYAKEIGKSVEALTKQERTLALTQAILKKTNTELKKFSERQSELTRSINQGQAALENFTSSGGRFLGGLTQVLASGVLVATTLFSLLAEAIVKAGLGFINITRLLPGMEFAFKRAGKALAGLDDDIGSLQLKMLPLAFSLGDGGLKAIFLEAGLIKVRKVAAELTPVLKETADATEEVEEKTEEATEAVEEFVEAEQMLKNEIPRATEKLKEQAIQAGITAREFAALSGQIDAATTRFVGFSTIGGQHRIFLAPRVDAGGSPIGGGSSIIGPGLSPFGTGGRFGSTNSRVTTLSNGRVVFL